MTNPLQVLHVTTGMAEGGAEAMLARLVANSNTTRIRHHLLALSHEGPLWEPTKNLCVSSLNLRLERPLLGLRRLANVTGFVRAARPDVIHGWMYHGNLAASWIRRWLVKSAALTFGVRQSLYDIRDERPLTRAVIRIGARQSSSADAVVYNSQISRLHHTSIGYHGERSLVIPNGFETRRFIPDESRRADTRARLRIAEGEFVVGIVGRFHPVKDHATFLQAATLVARTLPRSRFLVVGPGCTMANPVLRQLVERVCQGVRIELLGSWRDPTTLYPALDALCLTSRAEGFPNVVGEAMSCGVIPVCTDVGDIPALVGKAGFLSPVGDYSSIAAHLVGIGCFDREKARSASQVARERIIAHFSIDRIVEEYEELYERLYLARGSQPD
jgi:glycosyltransferase involved in cell wall biosynthesis